MFENKEKMVLVMEIAAGGELYDYISDRKTLGEPDARRIFRQIATAIYYCHKVGVSPRLFSFSRGSINVMFILTRHTLENLSSL